MPYAYPGESPAVFKSAGQQYVLTGLSGGVQSDGGESWSITVAMKRSDLNALKGELLLGKPLGSVLSGVDLPSKNTKCWIQGWSFEYKKGDIAEATIKAGIVVNTKIEGEGDDRTEETWDIETVEDEVPLVEVKSYWEGKIPVANTAENRAKVFAVATALANIEFNGLFPERGMQWQASARTILGSTALTADTFRSKIPEDLLARIQTGNISMKLGAFHVTRRKVTKSQQKLKNIGDEDFPSDSAIHIPERNKLTGRILSDSASHSSSTNLYTYTTIWKLTRKADN